METPNESRRAARPPIDGPARAALGARVVRWLLPLLGIAAVVAAIGMTRASREVTFVCPMHPEVRARAPGSCPICGMALGPVASAAPGAARASTELVVGDDELWTVRPRSFSREVHAPARVRADGTIAALLYADELVDRAAPGAAFTPSDASSAPVPVESTGEAPSPLDAGACWSSFRFAAGARPPAGAIAGWVTLAARPRALIVIPDTSIVHAPDGPYVLVASTTSPHTLARRSIDLGEVFFGMGVVVAGLAPGERIAGAASSWDAELRLRDAPAARPGGNP